MDGADSHIAIAREVEMNKKQIPWGRAWAFAIAMAAVGLAFPAGAQTTVEAVTGSIQGGSEVVRIDFSQPLAAIPAGFAIQAPARVALDVPNASNGLGRNVA